jgi:crotonobetainyl-CoA:carnitine CoA-transferase CaiB-like acyl-CoA transferase
VDSPSGPQWHSDADATFSRNKLIVTLDLHKEPDRKRARDLVASADVLIENFRPGVMDRWGLGAAEMTAAHPGLIYLSLPGFPSTNAELALVRAWEGIVLSAAGVFSDMCINRALSGNSPSYFALPIASANAAALGAVSVMVALLARQKTGRGDALEVPLLDAMLEASYVLRLSDLPQRHVQAEVAEYERRIAAGEPMDMTYEESLALVSLDPFYSRYRCKEGRKFFVCCTGNKAHVERLLKGFGLWDTLLAEGLPTHDPMTSSSTWRPMGEGSVYDWPFYGPWAERVQELLAGRFPDKTALEWEEWFAEHGIPGSMDRTTQEWLDWEPALAAGLTVDVPETDRGVMRQAGAHAWVRGYEGSYAAPQPAQPFDRHMISRDMETRSTATTGSGTPEGDHEPSLPLEDLHILDCANVIAAPLASATLARFGATITKLDPPETQMSPGNTIFYAFHAGKGKRSMLVDLRSPDGQGVLDRLVPECDVVLYNGTVRQLENMGLDLASLKRRNPSIVLCHVSGFGGPQPSPIIERRAYDQVAQSVTGLSVRAGGSLETPEMFAAAGTVDTACGFLAAFAVLVGVLESNRRGQAVEVGSSLMAAANLVQAPYMWDCKDREPFDEPAGPYVKGEHALYRLYRASDGWLFFGARRGQYEALRRLPEMADLPQVPPSLLGDGPMRVRSPEAATVNAQVEVSLEARFARRPAGEWVELLRQVGIGSIVVSSFATFMDEHIAIAPLSGETLVESPWPLFQREERHPSGHVVDDVAPTGIRPQHMLVKAPGPAPKFGAQTRELLAELGYDDEEIEAMIQKGVAGESWSDQYLPD